MHDVAKNGDSFTFSGIGCQYCEKWVQNVRCILHISYRYEQSQLVYQKKVPQYPLDYLICVLIPAKMFLCRNSCMCLCPHLNK